MENWKAELYISTKFISIGLPTFCLLFSLMVIFGLLVFYLFGRSVTNSVVWFSTYFVLWIWSNGPAQYKPSVCKHFKVTGSASFTKVRKLF